jgi:hypothetical protein
VSNKGIIPLVMVHNHPTSSPLSFEDLDIILGSFGENNSTRLFRASMVILPDMVIMYLPTTETPRISVYTNDIPPSKQQKAFTREKLNDAVGSKWNKVIEGKWQMALDLVAGKMPNPDQLLKMQQMQEEAKAETIRLGHHDLVGMAHKLGIVMYQSTDGGTTFKKFY